MVHGPLESLNSLSKSSPNSAEVCIGNNIFEIKYIYDAVTYYSNKYVARKCYGIFSRFEYR